MKARARTSAAADVGGSDAEIAPMILALIYDFDGTLSPRPMQEYSFLPQIGEDPKAFWAEVGEVARREEADSLITYMHLMYKKAKARNVRIDRESLVQQGRAVELFAGVEEWFDAIEEYIRLRAELPVEVRHYLVSSGLKEIIEGTSIYGRFHNVFASEYFFEAYELPYPKRVITDTGKTQYLFRINKGIEDQSKSINHHMPEADRPIPFANMVYFGDGDTDVPSMAVMRKNGGHAIAVHGGDRSPATCIELYEAGRCDFYAEADYRRGSELFQRTGLVIDSMLAGMRIEAERRRLSGMIASSRR
ncbi:MAG: HAD family hydrolase [Hyphomicrobiaceae bacterium]